MKARRSFAKITRKIEINGNFGILHNNETFRARNRLGRYLAYVLYFVLSLEKYVFQEIAAQS